MGTIRSHADYEQCVVEILRALGGRASPGQIKREFGRRYASSIPREEEGKWGPRLEGAQRRLERKKLVFAPDPEVWELS